MPLPKLDGSKVTIGLESHAEETLWRLVGFDHMKYAPGWRGSKTERATMIKRLLAEAIYAVDDWIDQQQEAGVTPQEITEDMRRIRFDFISVRDGGLPRRGLHRDQKACADADADAHAIEALLAKVSRETESDA